MSPKTRVLAVLMFIGLGWPVPISAAEDNSSSLSAAMHVIAAADLQDCVNYLADDAMEGREAGSRGGRAAGDFVASFLQQLKCKGAGVNGRFDQPFDGTCRNMLGLMEGSDPRLKQQIVVVSAHYDHVGYGTYRNSYGPVGHIHNGADDNASGVSGVLKLADAFATLKPRPKRSLLFAFFDAEEKGLLGSKYWAAHPTVPLAQVVFDVNIDMIGRLRQERLEVHGWRSGFGIRRLLADQNTAGDVWMDFYWAVKADSDQYSFFERGIPMVLLSTGEHAQYHRPSDKANLINNQGMQQVDRLAFQLVYHLAQQPETIAFRAAAGRESSATERGLFLAHGLPPEGSPMRVGISWQVDDAEPGTVILVGVMPDSPAARAGLQPGDRIIQLAGSNFADDAAFAAKIRNLPGPIEVLIERGGRLYRVNIPLGQQQLKRAA